MVMSREEVFRATGPTSGANIWVKIGVTKDGRITAAEAVLKYQARRLPGRRRSSRAAWRRSPPTTSPTSRSWASTCVTNRPKVAAYRAPGAPISEFAVECVIDELAKKLGLDPIEFRLQERRQGGHARRPTARSSGRSA